jgi:hypothetical protein
MNGDRLLFSEGDSCHEFDDWLQMKHSGIAVDFRRFFRFGSDLPELRLYLLGDSVIDEMRMICGSKGIVNRLYRRIEDSLLMVVELIIFSDLMNNRLIENKIEDLINLCHPCITAPIGFVFAAGSKELKVLRLYSESESLAEVIAANPMWWTPTTKAKAVVGLVLGLRFAHSLGLIHGCLTTKHIIFDLNHCIQITAFLSSLSKQGICGFSDEGWNPETDVRGFLSVLFEIVVGCPMSDEASIPADVPIFVSEMIEVGLSGELRRLSSFCRIFETLKQHDFGIVAGVDFAEVLGFVDWVESLVQSRE